MLLDKMLPDKHPWLYRYTYKPSALAPVDYIFVAYTCSLSVSDFNFVIIDFAKIK